MVKCLVYTVATLIMMAYVTHIAFIIIPSSDYYFHTLKGNLHFVFMNCLLSMVIYSYRNIVKAGPGRIPFGWAPSGFTEEELEEAKQNADKEKRRKYYPPHLIRFCKKCNSFKPPRSHHCRECDLCVPRMDHHCPWINNCVGNDNHKLFVLFLFWGVLGISYAVIALLSRVVYLVYDVLDEKEVTLTAVEGVAIAVNSCFFLPMILGMGSLLAWHINLAAMNTTTIEFNEKMYALRLSKKKNITYRWPYDFGCWENLKLFFGRKYSNWCFPVPPEYLSDGVTYLTSIELKKYVLFSGDEKDEQEVLEV